MGKKSKLGTTRIKLKTPDSDRPLEEAIVVRGISRPKPEELQANRDKAVAQAQLKELIDSQTEDLYCTECNLVFSWVNLGVGTHRFYLLEDGTQLPVEETTQFCGTCSKITWVEALSFEETIEVVTRNAALAAEAIEREAARYANWFSRFFTSKRTFDELATDVIRSRKAHQLTELRATTLLRRQTPPRCLTCGSFNISEFKKPFAPGASEPANLYAHHPLCGGLLYVQRPRYSLRANAPHMAMFYSPDGEFLYERELEDGDLL